MGLQPNMTNAICDGAGCGQIVGMREAKPGEIPEGWYRVSLEGEAHKKSGEWIFHSLACVGKWSQERRRALGLVREIHRTEVAVRADAPVLAGVGAGVDASNGSGRSTVLGERKRQQARENRELVLLAFEDDPNLELTNSQIRAATGLSDNGVRPHVEALIEAGKLRIANPGSPNSKSDVRTYALVPD